MNFFEAIVLGIIEGLTEFLPVSSTGHLILVGEMLRIPDSVFRSSFEIAIQLGAILAVVVLYWRAFLSLALLKKLGVAFVPTAIVGIIFYPLIKSYLLGNEQVVLAALFLGGIVIIVFEKLYKEGPNAVSELGDISWKSALWVGIFQSVAIIPGVSRSAASILGGLVMGLKRRVIVEFSFLLAVPTMLAATALDLFKSSADFSVKDVGLIMCGFVTAFISALLVIRFLLWFIQGRSFVSFGVYRLIVAILFALLVL